MSKDVSSRVRQYSRTHHRIYAQKGKHSPWTHCLLFGPSEGMKDPENLKELGRRIRHLRKEGGFTQEHFADDAGLDRSYFGGIERGERNITFSVLCQVAKALHVDIAHFTSGLPVRPQ